MLVDIAYGLFYLTVLAVRSVVYQVAALPHIAARGLSFLSVRDKSNIIMDAGDNDMNSVDSKESKGGLKFEVIYSGATSPPPSKTLVSPLSPKSIISVENIDNKLKAATDRRRTIEAIRQQQFEEKGKRIEEVVQKKEEQNEIFKQQSKALLEQKIVTATEAREAQISALLERLREHEKHIAEVRKQMDEQTDQLRERSVKKLERAQEKRQGMLQDLQVKQTEHLAKVDEIRQAKALQDAQNENQGSNDNEGSNENSVTLSG